MPNIDVLSSGAIQELIVCPKIFLKTPPKMTEKNRNNQQILEVCERDDHNIKFAVFIK